MRIRKLLFVLLSFFTVVPSFVFAEEYKSGDIKNPIVTASQDGITITKKVSKTDSDFVYNVEFTIEGKNIIDTLVKDVYVSFIFDKSGSMLCDNGTKVNGDIFYNKSTTINNQVLYCNFMDSVKTDKWNNAVNGAIGFSHDIISNVPTAKLNLFTFSTDVDLARDFKSEGFKESDFGYPNGSTNLSLAIDRAKSSLDSISDSSLKYIVIISDGDPDDVKSLKSSVNNVKAAGVKIYTIGYDTKSDTKEILKEISSGEGFYYDANIEGLGNVLKNLATEIYEVASGSDAIMLDTLGDAFSYKSGDVVVDKNKVSYNFNEISAEKVVFDFDISLNDGLTTGWYVTNDIDNEGVVLKYKDVNNEDKKIVMNSSSEVYFEKEKGSYIVNYYKDSISLENFLGRTEGLLEIGSVLESDSIEKDKYLPLGYSSDNVDVSDLIIGTNDNVINIVYSKNKYPYHIEYYKDEISLVNLIAKSRENYQEYALELTQDMIAEDFGASWLNLYRPDNYKDGVQVNSNIVIDLDNNVVKVLYSKKDTSLYKIEYYFNGELDDSKTVVVTDIPVGMEITDLTFTEFTNYYLQKVDNYPFTVSDNEKENVIRVYYSLEDGIVPPPNTFVDSGFNFSFIICVAAGISLIFLVGKKRDRVNK